MDSSSVFVRNSERENTVQTKCTFVEVLISLQIVFKRIRQEKKKARATGDFWTIDEQNVRLGNVLDVDMKIT